VITQSIYKVVSKPHRTPHTNEAKPRFVAGSEEHKRYIFQKTLDETKFEPGDMVCRRSKRSKETGQVINVEDTFEMVSWNGLMCKFIEVYWYDSNDMGLYHPSELRTG
jgi:hypothetical protein